MKVLCVDATSETPLPFKEGDILTVSGEDNETYCLPAYYFFECPPHQPYDKNRFIPLSSIDETEMQREYNLQTQNQ